jgi:hypothetical protein
MDDARRPAVGIGIYPPLIDGDLRLGNKNHGRTYQLAGPNDEGTFVSVNLHVEVLELNAVASEHPLNSLGQILEPGAARVGVLVGELVLGAR